MARGWTLEELARASSLSTRFIGDIEAGFGNASILKLSQIADALTLSLPELFAAVQSTQGAAVVGLLGIRGAGKSRVGTAVAKRLGVPFVELDVLIEDAAGLSVTEIFALHGEHYYRQVELNSLRSFLVRSTPCILAGSGGIVTSPEAFQLLEDRCRLVWLKAPPEVYLDRVLEQGDMRPMRDRPHAMAELRALLKVREPLYGRAEFVLDTDKLGFEKSVQTLETRLRPFFAAPSPPLGMRSADLFEAGGSD